MERQELTGRSIYLKKPLTCILATVIRVVNGKYNRVKYIVTDKGEFRLASGIYTTDFEIGTTYFMQTVKWNFKFAPIEVVDYIKT